MESYSNWLFSFWFLVRVSLVAATIYRDRPIPVFLGVESLHKEYEKIFLWWIKSISSRKIIIECELLGNAGGGGAGAGFEELVDEEKWPLKWKAIWNLRFSDVKHHWTYAIGGGGGGGLGTVELIFGSTLAPFADGDSSDGGGGGAFGKSDAFTVIAGISDCFRLGLEMSLRQYEQVNFCTLGVRNKRVESSRFSSNVARCTSVSAQSHIISLIASFESIRNKCWRMLKNGISCGVSAT